MLDAIVIGAGPAGISAARTLIDAGRSVMILEARSRMGGRAHTIEIAGRAVDVGAHWMHMAERNPLTPLARQLGVDAPRAPDDHPLYDGGRRVVGARRRAMSQGWRRLDRALARVERSGVDRPLSDCMPDLGEWTDSFAFGIGLYSGAACEQVSALDYYRTEDGSNRFPKGGYGALIARLAESLPVRLSCPATAVRREADRVVVETASGAVEARHAIVAIPMALLQAGAIAFDPALPGDVAAAIGAFLPAAYEHAVVHWPDSPLHANGPDQLTFFGGDRLLGATMLACVEGSDLHYLELGGPHRAVWNNGDESWKRAHATRFLSKQFGAAAANATILHVTDWWNDPWSRGSWSVCPPGSSAARERLRRFGGERLSFASEATSLTQWGTIGGAWREGERAARAIIAGASR